MPDLRGHNYLVRAGGVEPPSPYGHWDLNPARLPVSPHPHPDQTTGCQVGDSPQGKIAWELLGP